MRCFDKKNVYKGIRRFHAEWLPFIIGDSGRSCQGCTYHYTIPGRRQRTVYVQESLTNQELVR